jgi:uncharacterized protein YpuA (DUF1002 family)
MQKFIRIVTMLALLMTLFVPSISAKTTNVKSINEKLGVPIVVYGANLSKEERAYVEKALSVEEEPEVDEISISGEDLVKYIKNSNAKSRMYSSAKITRQEEGKGVIISIVTPDNITQVTAEMYATAMLTAGITDAIVEVAAPKPVTGHSALVGIYKAYELKTGEELDIERTDVANEELSVATDLASKSGVSDQEVAELLTEIKRVIAEKNPATKEDVEKIVRDQLDKFNIDLGEGDISALVELMHRISKLDIDFDKLSDQLSDLSNSFKDKFGDIIENEGFWQSVKNFFANLFNAIANLFK